jgi:hypothetical protein
VRHVKNEHVFALDAVKDDVLPHGKASQAGAQILIATAAYMGMAGKGERSGR